MRGHAPLIAMRRCGAMPATATVHVDHCPRDWSANWPEFTSTALIDFAQSDSVARTDWRPFVGLPLVWVTGEAHQRDRVMAVFDAILAAKAQRVIAVISGPAPMFRTLEMLDSKGEATWLA